MIVEASSVDSLEARDQSDSILVYNHALTPPPTGTLLVDGDSLHGRPRFARDRDKQPRLLDRVRAAIRLRHYSRRTERAYVSWIRRFILFHGKRHPKDMGAAEVEGFLSSLATNDGVSASTQNQALAALLFLYPHVLDRDLPWMDEIVRAKRPKRLPVVLTRAEVARVIDQIDRARNGAGGCRCLRSRDSSGL